MIDIEENPFSVHSPDALDEVPAEQIVNLFVEDHTKLPSIKQRKHTFIWGSRGSGKSFMLRYLEPQCQFIEHSSAEEFFMSEQPFIGIYTPCKKGEIDKSELDLLDEAAARTLSEHLLNLTIAEETISTLNNQFPDDFISQDDARSFATYISTLFDSASIASSKDDADRIADQKSEPFLWVEELISAEKRRVTHYLRKLPFSKDASYTGATSGYHDFLLPMMRRVQRLVGFENVPVYVFLDDAFHLTESQQKVVNTWIANRDQGVLCIKVSSSAERYETFETVGRGRIEKTHDFTEVDIEELYTRSEGQYSEKVRKIANKRLEISNVPTSNIGDFLPPNEFEEDLLEEIKQETREEWEEEGRPGRESDYVARYAKARLFQELAQRKNEKSYAGFENLVHISSGIIRNFLEPCYLMFNECLRDSEKPSEIKEIPPSVQDRILKDYSEEFLKEQPEKIKRDLPPEQMSHLDKLTTLINSLGRLFYERLHDPDSREPRWFSFTIKGEIESGSELSEVLELGITMQYFRVRTYSSKEGGGREDWYILNRRLAPMFKIDPTGFQGRIRLTPTLLEIGCRDTDEFVRRAIDLDKKQTELSDWELVSTYAE